MIQVLSKFAILYNKPKFSQISLLFSFGLFLSLIIGIQLITSRDVSNSPDETGESLFINHIAEKGVLADSENISINKSYRNLFAPRGTVVNENGEIVPLKTVMTMYVLGVPYTFINRIFDVSKFQIVINGISIFVFVLYVTKFLSPGRQNFLLLPMLLVAIYLFHLDRLLNLYNMFLFVSFYYFKKWTDRDGVKFLDKKLVLSSIFISLTTLLRNELIILYIPIGVMFLYLILIKKWSWNILFYFIFPLISLITVLISNQMFYNSFFSFGYSLDSQSRDAFKEENRSILTKVLNLFLLYGFKPSHFLLNAWNYIVVLFPLLLFPAIINIKMIKKNLIFSVTILLISLYLIIYYGSNPYFWGHGEITMDSSYVRYFTPIYLFLFTFAASKYYVLYTTLWNAKKIVLFLLSSLIIFSIHSTSKKISADYDGNIRYVAFVENFKRHVPENSVIFTTYWDKLIYKDYEVATMSKQVKDMHEYFAVMREYFIENQDKKVYFIPKDVNEQKYLENYITQQSDIECKDIDYLSMCKLQLKEN